MEKAKIINSEQEWLILDYQIRDFSGVVLPSALLLSIT